jgi:hypothetical protein
MDAGSALVFDRRPQRDLTRTDHHERITSARDVWSSRDDERM